jgi:hypothetical protein
LCAARKRAQIFCVRALFLHALARRSRLCAEQNNFAQVASREAVAWQESIKKERISAK